MNAVSEPRHVVFLATDFRPMTGGIAEYLHNLAHHLARRVPVTVMTSVDQRGAAWEHAYRLVQLPPLPERRLGRRAGDRVPPIRKVHTGLYFRALRAYARRVADEVARIGDKTMVVVGAWDTASHFWCEACRHRGFRYAMAAHGLDVLVPLYGRLPAWRREDFARADCVLACSRATADMAAERLGLEAAPVVVLPSVGPRPADDAIRARTAVLRRELNLPDGLVLFSLGRLVPRKGFDLVVRAVSDLSREGRSLAYVVAGDGPERSSIERLAQDLGVGHCIRLLGQVDELTKWAAYELADVFLMPNRLLGGLDWEGFGIVFLEAALAGRPAVGGRSGGAGEAIEDEVTGVLVDPEEPGAVAQAVRRLMDDEDLRRRLGAAGRRRALTAFAADAGAAKLWGTLSGESGRA